MLTVSKQFAESAIVFRGRMLEALRRELVILLPLGGIWLLLLVDWGRWAGGLWLLYGLYHLFQAGRVLKGRPPLSIGAWPAVWGHFSYLARKQQKTFTQREAKLLQFEKMLKALPLGVMQLDQHDAIVWENDSAQQLLKLKPEDRGKPVQYLLRLPEFVHWLENKPVTPLKLIMPEPKLNVLKFQLLPFSAGFLLLIQDITAEYDLDQVRQDFVANASHELRTPVTVFIGYLETFLSMSEQLPAAQRTAMEHMAQQAHRMQQVIEDLLVLSSIERMESLQNEQVIDMVELVKLLEEEAQQLSGGCHSMTFDVQSSLGIKGEPALVRSICSNLISNAIRYTPAEGQINVIWRVDAAGQGVFEVKDTGIGIPREHLARLTERFYRVDTARSRAQGGTGLGLAIVKHALEQHGGRLEIESAPRLGSTFRAIFPKARVTELS